MVFHARLTKQIAALRARARLCCVVTVSAWETWTWEMPIVSSFRTRSVWTPRSWSHGLHRVRRRIHIPPVARAEPKRAGWQLTRFPVLCHRRTYSI